MELKYLTSALGKRSGSTPFEIGKDKRRKYECELNAKFKPSDCVVPTKQFRQNLINAPKYQNKKIYETFNDTQRRIVDVVLDKRENVFFSGSAGSGKSTVLKFLISELIERHGKDKVGVTAPTGLAACNINGDTLHSFCGISFNKIYNKNTLKRWKRIKVLIIDEISMVDGYLFTKLDALAQKIRGSSKPFGGVQIIVTGDFFQLPPIKNNGSPVPIFCFDSKSWNSTFHNMILLDEIFRQKADSRLLRLLESLRYGNLNDQDLKMLKSLKRNPCYQDEVSAVQLFATRDDVKFSNSTELEKLQYPLREFNAVDTGPANFLKKLDDLLVQDKLLLKQECQVMLVKNKKHLGLNNGSVGVVKFFASETDWQAIVSHFTTEEMDTTDFSSAYTLIKESKKSEVPKQRAIQHKLSRVLISNKDTMYPVVKFSGKAGRFKIILPEAFVVESPTMPEPCVRVQIPLVLSYAMSIHKSQGQTLERVKIDLSKVFEKGQIYTAISRAVSMDGLQVVGFRECSLIEPNMNVKMFYKKIHKSFEINQF